MREWSRSCGKRTLLAKTCGTCMELKQADEYRKTTDGYYQTECLLCFQKRTFAIALKANDDSRDAAENHRQLWDGSEMDHLRENMKNKVPDSTTAAELGRTIAGIRAMRLKMRRGLV